MGLTGLRQIDRALGGAGQRRLVDLEGGNLSAQHRIFQTALLVAADRIGGDLAERPADAALAHAGDHRTLVLQEIFRDIPAAIDRTDHVGLRYAHIIEEGLAKRRAARNQENRLGRDALGGHVEQDETDAVMLFGSRIGPHQTEDPVGEVRVRGPYLLAVDDEVVAVALGAGLQRCEVRSGVRLGITLAPADQASRDFRQMLLLLRIGAVFQQRRSEHPDAETRQRRAGTDGGHFLAQDLGLGGV